jgi:hypothetical protein
MITQKERWRRWQLAIGVEDAQMNCRIVTGA